MGLASSLTWVPPAVFLFLHEQYVSLGVATDPGPAGG